MAEKKEDKKEDKAQDKKEAGEAGEGEEGGKALGGKKKLIIIILAAVLALAGIGAGVFFSGILGGGEEEAAPEAAAETGAQGEGESHGGGGEGEEGEHGEGQAPAVAGAPVFYDMPEFLVNLNTGGGKVSFLKMSVTLEVAKQADVPVIEANLPRIQDSFNTYLREVRASDLSGSAGMYRLREELLARVNQAVAPAKINDVLFKDFIVQ